jgi:hypothetical protein
MIPTIYYVLGGFKSFAYNFYHIFHAMIMIPWLYVWSNRKFKRFNGLKKFALFLLIIVVQCSIPEKWDVDLSAGFVLDSLLFLSCLILTIFYYRKVLKDKVDDNGNDISNKKN